MPNKSSKDTGQTTPTTSAAPEPPRLAYSMNQFLAAVGNLSRGQARIERMEGRLKVVKVGRRVLIPIGEAERWLRERTVTA